MNYDLVLYAILALLALVVWEYRRVMRRDFEKPKSVVYELPVVELGDEDVLVILSEKALSSEQARKLQESWRIAFEAQRLPGLPRTLVLDSGLTLSVLRRPRFGRAGGGT